MWLKPPWLLTTTTRHVILEEVLSGVGGGEMGIPGFDDLFPEFGANAALESYSYMDAIVNTWNEIGILKDIMQHKLVFIETQDVVETTLALHNYRKACDCGREAYEATPCLGHCLLIYVNLLDCGTLMLEETI